MLKLPHLFSAVLWACSGMAVQAAVPLRGVILDFCAPGTANCTQLPDFEEAHIGGVVTGMVNPQLTNGLPTPGPAIGDGSSSPANFAKWYTDAPGYNLRLPYSISAHQIKPGIMGFSNIEFYPIDGRGFGNQGRIHNYHFTMHLNGRISFDDPTVGIDRSFTARSDDDLWVFVDGKLVADLGGVHGSSDYGFFDEERLNAMGLVAGKPYALDIFFAERHTTGSVLDFQTNFNIAAVPEPASWVLWGVGVAGLVMRRRIRAARRCV